MTDIELINSALLYAPIQKGRDAMASLESLRAERDRLKIACDQMSGDLMLLPTQEAFDKLRADRDALAARVAQAAEVAKEIYGNWITFGKPDLQYIHTRKLTEWANRLPQPVPPTASPAPVSEPQPATEPICCGNTRDGDCCGLMDQPATEPAQGGVQRFDLVDQVGYGGHMAEDPEGDYVRHADYDALRAAKESAERERDAYRAAVAKLADSGGYNASAAIWITNRVAEILAAREPK